MILLSYWNDSTQMVPDRLDAFPNERTQSYDTDNDGYGDNPIGIDGDDCIYQWQFYN